MPLRLPFQSRQESLTSLLCREHVGLAGLGGAQGLEWAAVALTTVGAESKTKCKTDKDNNKPQKWKMGLK